MPGAQEIQAAQRCSHRWHLVYPTSGYSMLLRSRSLSLKVSHVPGVGHCMCLLDRGAVITLEMWPFERPYRCQHMELKYMHPTLAPVVRGNGWFISGRWQHMEYKLHIIDSPVWTPHCGAVHSTRGCTFHFSFLQLEQQRVLSLSVHTSLPSVAPLLELSFHGETRTSLSHTSGSHVPLPPFWGESAWGQVGVAL